MMTYEDVLAIADHAATTLFNAVKINDVTPEQWFSNDNTFSAFQRTDVISKLASFVMRNRTAPTEALYIYSGGQGFHSPGAFEQEPRAVRLAYAGFLHSLLALENALIEQVDVEKLAAPAQAPIAAALLIDPRDTILELVPDPLEVRKDAVLTIPSAPAASEKPTSAPIEPNPVPPAAPKAARVEPARVEAAAPDTVPTEAASAETENPAT